VSAASPWERHARQWSLIGPPLRPAPEDVAIATAALRAWRDARGADPTLLLMGVTPELCALPTGERSRVIAVDRSIDMIRAVWPGRLRPRDEVLCGDWRRLPLRSASVDIVLADGCLTNLPFPSGYKDICSEVRRVLRADGRWIARAFVQPGRPEAPEDVLADAAYGRAGGYHAWKWRLAMALQPDANAGVRVAEVWDTFHRAHPDVGELARRCAWPVEVVRTIDAYRGVETHYSFPTLTALQEHFLSAGFAPREVTVPSYELGERCPTLLLAPVT
jgi:SAM-dependent methyltransferase